MADVVTAKSASQLSNQTTITPNLDTTSYIEDTAVTGAVTIANWTGTPAPGQRLWVAITGTAARAISFGTAYEASTVALPTTTSGTNRLDIGFVYNPATSKMRVVATA